MGIPEYRWSEHTQRRHAERMRPSELREHYNGVGEAEVVPGFQLSEIMLTWVRAYIAERPIGKDFVGPIGWLAEKTGINPRRVQGICNGEYSTVGVSQADALLSAIERTDLFTSLWVSPNPNWSNEKWIEYLRERGCA
jgi:hypothetical protein